MSNQVNSKSVVEIIKRKDYLTFYNKEKVFKVKIKPVNFQKILKMMGRPMEYAINYISLIQRNMAETAEKSYGEDQEDVLARFLSRKEDFLVLPDWNEDMDENDKMVIGIDLRKEDLQKISCYMGERFIYMMNYLELSLTSESYGELSIKKKKALQKKKSMNKYMELIRTLNSLQVTFPNDNTSDLSGSSFEVIQRLAEFSLNDIIKSVGIQVLGKDSKTIVGRCKLFEQNLENKFKDDVKDTDEFGFYPIEQGAKLLEKIDLDNKGAEDFDEVLNAYNKLQKNINDKKQEVKNYCNKKNNIFYEIDNIDRKTCYLNKCYFDTILQSNANLPDKFKIKDVNDNYSNFKTDQIKKVEKDRKKQEYVKIGLPNSKADALVNKKKLLMKVDEMKSYKHKNEIPVIQKFEDKDYISVSLEEMQLPEQTDINKNSIESQIKSSNSNLDKKKDLLKQLKKEQNSYIEYENGKLFNDSLLPQIQNNKDKIDVFYLPNSAPNAEKPKFKANKKDLAKKAKDENAKFVKILDKDTEKIVSKKDLSNALINTGNNCKLNEYTPNGKKKNNFNLKEVEIIEIGKEDLPLQVTTENERIKKELQKDVNFIKTKDIKNDPILVREKLQKIIAEKKPKKDVYDVYTKTRSDNRNLNKVTPDELLNKENPKYVELSIDQGNDFQSKSIVNRQMLEDALQDEENDEIKLEDEFGAPLTAKKSNIHVVVPPEISLPPQSKEQKDEILKKLENTKSFMYVENEEPKDKFIRSEYVDLIKDDKPNTPFDRYEIPDDKGNKTFVSKAYLENKFKPEDNEFVKVTIKGNPHYVLKKDLTVEPTNSKYNVLMEDRNKADVVFNDLDIPPITEEIKTLPEQPEEKLIEDLNKKKNVLNSTDDEIELAAVKNSEGNQVFVPRKYIVEIKDGFREKDGKGNCSVKDYLENEIKIPSEEAKDIDDNNRYVPIKLILENGDENEIVNKIDLAGKINKMNTPREYARVSSAIDKKKPLSICSQNFEIEEVKGYDPKGKLSEPIKEEENKNTNVNEEIQTPGKEEENKNINANEEIQTPGKEEEIQNPSKEQSSGKEQAPAQASGKEEEQIPVKEEQKEEQKLSPFLMGLFKKAAKSNEEEKKEEAGLNNEAGGNEEGKSQIQLPKMSGLDIMKSFIIRNLQLEKNLKNRDLKGKKLFTIRRAIIKKADA